MLLNVHRNRKAYWGPGEGEKVVWRWGEEGMYTYLYTLTTRITLALRWAAMTAILTFH